MIGAGGSPFLYLEFGDIVIYFSPYTLSLFLLALVFTVLVIASRPRYRIRGRCVHHQGYRSSRDEVSAVHGYCLRTCLHGCDGHRGCL